MARPKALIDPGTSQPITIVPSAPKRSLRISTRSSERRCVMRIEFD
jgi:hypothetical protein